MLEHAEKIYAELLAALKMQDDSDHAGDCIPDPQMSLIQEVMDWIKTTLPNYDFQSEADEIRFFKTMLPQFLSLQIYYGEKIELESMERAGTRKAKEVYCDRALRRVNDFFNDNAEFFAYYRSGKTNLDAFYFLRNSAWNQESMILAGIVADPVFCPAYSIRQAAMIAYKKLEVDLIDEAMDIKDKVTEPVANENGLAWTGSKVDLTELSYALKEAGCFNNGQASVKEIIDWFQSSFRVDIGNYSRTFQEILIRKKGYTPFLNKLTNALVGRIDSIEGEHIK